MSANCSLAPLQPNCKFHKNRDFVRPPVRTSRAHSANSKSMLSSLAMSSTTIKEIDFEVSQPWDDDGDTWDAAAEEGGRFPRKRSLPAARPKTRHRSVGTTMAPAEEHVLVGKGGRVRRTKVRQRCACADRMEGGRPRGRNFSNRSRGSFFSKATIEFNGGREERRRDVGSGVRPPRDYK